MSTARAGQAGRNFLQVCGDVAELALTFAGQRDLQRLSLVEQIVAGATATIPGTSHPGEDRGRGGDAGS